MPLFQFQHAVRALQMGMFMCHHQNTAAILAKFRKELDKIGRTFRIQIRGRFVRK